VKIPMNSEGKTMAQRAAVFLVAAAALHGAAFAQEPGPEGQEGGADTAAAKKDEGDWFAVVNGDVYTGTGAVLRGATVLARGGVIREIGHEVEVPAEAKVLDANGLRVYPGLVALNARGVANRLGGGDYADSFDPYSQNLVLALAAGITTVSESGVAIKLKRREVKGVVVRERYLSTLNFSSNTPRSKSELEQKFEAAAKFLREFRDYEEQKKTNKELKEPSPRGVDPTIRAILENRSMARFNVTTRTDLLGIARLAQKYKFRPIVEGATEAWTVADELGRAGAYAVVVPRTRRDKSEELQREGGSSIENAALLHRSGVQVAIQATSTFVDLGGIAGRDILHLPIEAGFAVRGGLPEQAALEGITIVPARILGVEHRVGSLEVGKDCDLIVLDGDLLHYQALVQYTVVDGKLVYEKDKELYYAHIRPRPTAAPTDAPEARRDKGEEATEAKDEGDEKPEDKPEDKPAEKPEEKPEDDPEDGR
jgi:imidazolonepropionase-like amidohydrolase